MENQHREIKGYRDFNSDTIRRINALKQKEKEVLALIHELDKEALELSDPSDPRWKATGITDIQKGFMAVIRSHAKPE